MKEIADERNPKQIEPHCAGCFNHTHVDGILLQRNSSFAWATGGSSAAINIASSTGEASLLVTPQNAYVITNNIEAARLEGEEELCQKGCEFYHSRLARRHRRLRDDRQGLQTRRGRLHPGHAGPIR